MPVVMKSKVLENKSGNNLSRTFSMCPSCPALGLSCVWGEGNANYRKRKKERYREKEGVIEIDGTQFLKGLGRALKTVAFRSDLICSSSRCLRSSSIYNKQKTLETR